MNNEPRHIAFNILVHSNQKNRTLDQSIDKFALQLDGLSKRDRKLANAIIYGTLRTRAHLDWIIQSFSSRELIRIDIRSLYILRIALFQIIYLERIPASAAVNTAVTIAKKVSDKKASGFVNAVLRKASTDHSQVALPDKDKKPALYLSVKKSISLMLASRWIQRFGFEQASKICDSIKEIPPITIRANSLKTNREALFNLLQDEVKNIELTRFSKNGLSFTNPETSIMEMNTFQKGLFQVQDEAAQLVTFLLDPKPEENILDACAGLGGKTGHIAQLMNNKGRIIAADTDIKKLNSLKESMTILGINIVKAEQKDILNVSIKDFDGFFDRVLLDAPCTGLGVLKRNPDTVWSKTKHDIQRNAAKQKKLLNSAANLVKPGGVIVYAVCSCEPEENEDVVFSFLKKRKDYFICNNTPHYFNKDIEEIINKDGFIKTYPKALFMDGFFAACLQRRQKE